MDKIYSFVFKGLLAETALDKNGRKTPLLNSAILEKELTEKLSLELLDKELVEKAKRMATVYTAIASFENSVRDFVSKRLLEEVGENWWDTCVSQKIRDKAKSRHDEEAKIRWHAKRGDALMNYIEFGDLSSIITQQWQNFEDHFQSLEWVHHIISTLERSRNVIMHSGELETEDIDRIGSVIRDWIKQVGT